MRWIVTGLIALALASAMPSGAAVPKHQFAEPKLEKQLPVTDDWEMRYRLYQYYCAMYQHERRIRWIIHMKPDHVAEFQRWSRKRQANWWMYLSHVVGCDF